MSPADTTFVPLVPPGFSPLPTHSPNTTIFVPQNSTSFVSVSIQPQNSKSTTLATSSFESISIPNYVPVNNYPMQTRSKSGIHNPRLHPLCFLPIMSLKL